MKISVVISTYNGEKYILKQLDSLRLQTRKIDEVIIDDDCSSDNTTKIVEAYIKKYNLNNWILSVEPVNRGWRVNFREALCKSTGDLIFPCDQDDVWHLDKIECMENAYMSSGKPLLLLSNVHRFKSQYNSKLITNDNLKNTTKKFIFNKKSFHLTHPGCSMCLSREMLKYFSMYATDDVPHDGFIYELALLLDSVVLYNGVTIEYRRHSETATGRHIGEKRKKILDVKYFLIITSIMEKFLLNEDIKDYKYKHNVIKNLNRWAELRHGLLTNKEYFNAFKLLRYLSYYPSLKTYFGDIFAVVRG